MKKISLLIVPAIILLFLGSCNNAEQKSADSPAVATVAPTIAETPAPQDQTIGQKVDTAHTALQQKAAETKAAISSAAKDAKEDIKKTAKEVKEDVKKAAKDTKKEVKKVTGKVEDKAGEIKENMKK